MGTPRKKRYTLCPQCHGAKRIEVVSPLPECVAKDCPTCNGTGLYRDIRVGKYFRLREFVASQTALRKGLDNSPSKEAIAAIKLLCKDLLDPLRRQFGPIHINSGYRSSDLNIAIGGSPTSSHRYGAAGDVVPGRKSVTLKEMVDWVILKDLPYDQIIFEGTWIHIGRFFEHADNPLRKMKLMMFDGKYMEYDPEDPRVIGVRR